MQWSSPLFFTVNAAGAGATLGASEIASVVVLDTPEACDAFLRTQVESGTVQTVLLPILFCESLYELQRVSD